MNETDAINLFKKRVNRGAFFKLHGGRYQSCLPDIMWFENNSVMFLEFKIVDGNSLPWSKLRLDQHLTILKIMKYFLNVAYAVYSKKEECFYRINPANIVEGETYKMDEKERWICYGKD